MTEKRHQTLIDNYHKEQLENFKNEEHELDIDYDDEDTTIH